MLNDNTNGSALSPLERRVSLHDAMAEQTPGGGEFICQGCAHYRGGVTCALWVFISTVGANTSNCAQFQTAG